MSMVACFPERGRPMGHTFRVLGRHLCCAYCGLSVPFVFLDPSRLRLL